MVQRGGASGSGGRTSVMVGGLRVEFYVVDE